MVNFTVAEIADALGTNPETVRRWIRNGELEAIQDSRKDGSRISEESMRHFLSKHLKYAKQAESSTAFSRIAKEARGKAILERSMRDIGSIKINETDSWLAEAKATLAEKRQEVKRLEENIATLEAILTVWRQNDKGDNV